MAIKGRVHQHWNDIIIFFSHPCGTSVKSYCLSPLHPLALPISIVVCFDTMVIANVISHHICLIQNMLIEINLEDLIVKNAKCKDKFKLSGKRWKD